MFNFQYTELLYALGLLPVILIIFFYAKRHKKRSVAKIGDPELVKQLMSQYKAASFVTKFIFVFLAIGLLAVGLANPRQPSGGNDQSSRSGIDVMIALDVSRSMLAQDVKPTRLDRAKQLLSRLIDKLGNDRIGIVVFAGKAYLQMPLSGDHAAAKMYLSAATPESIPTQGTVIGDALKMCYASFDSKEKKYKAVVLISDGEDHDEGAIKIASDMADQGVVINSVGIGSKEGAPIIDETTGDYKKDAEGNTVISKLNEEELQSIAKKTNGIYQYFVSTDNALSNIVASFSNMPQRAVKDESLMSYQSFFQWFIGLALLFLLIELFISETRQTRVSKLRPAAVIIFLMFSSSLLAQDARKSVKEGNEAYKKNDFVSAKDSYRKALNADTANTAAQYNLGNAFYKSGKKDSALIAYERSVNQLKTPADKEKAYYNKGVVLQNDKKLEECIAAYKSALRIDPNDDDARQNLQKALKQQQQQQKQDDKKDNKKDQQDNNKQKQEPRPQPSKMSPKDAEEKLKALMQQEKNLQDKLHKVNAQSPNKPEKDW